ncbi:MAG: hypothetical protein QOG62_1656 [Thermoleophilaceae bacterium]|jgi:hypothetical protein|nr:hypothetical protein [Thermoleophilaceae bacterium]
MAAMTSFRLLIRISLASTATCALLALTGCFGPAGSGDTDPATIAPATTPVLLEATVDPEGDQETAVRALLAKFPGGDSAASGGFISSLIQDGLTAAGAPINYAEDIQPWLGQKASLFVTGVNADSTEPEVALVLSTTDAGQAEAALQKAFPGGTEKTVEGVKYRLGPQGDLAVGVVDNFVVIGTPTAYTSVIAASKGNSLSESDTYDNAVSALPESRIAAFFVDPKALVSLTAGSAGIGGPEMAAQQAALNDIKPVVGSVSADANGIVVDSATTKVPGMVVPQPGTDVLGDLPGDSGVALGIPDLGASAKASLTQAGSSAGMDPDMINSIAKSQFGIDALGMLDWIGNTGIFVSGKSLSDAGGGLVIQSKDPAASADSLKQIQGFLGDQKDVSLGKAQVDGDAGFSIESKDLPAPVVVEQRGSALAIALGAASAEAALGTDDRLSANPAYQAAVARLGADYDPSMYVGLGPLLDFAVKNFGLDKDPTFAAVAAYLTPLTDMTAGGRVDGETLLSRFRIDIQ